jgi:hypothetical protein
LQLALKIQASFETFPQEIFMNAVAQAATPDVNEVPAPLVFTDSAADKVNQLIEEEGNPEL